MQNLLFNEIDNKFLSDKKIISEVRKLKWRKKPYRFQNWANWLH